MNAPDFDAWTEANQQLMVAELARLKQRLGGEGDAATLVQTVQLARAAMPAPAAIDRLAERLGLSAFERDVLLLCAGVDMDAQFAAQCDAAGSEPRRPGPTFSLALAALEAPHWSALAPVRPLRRWRLLEVDEAAGLARARLRIDERILHFLAGVNYLDVRLRSLLHHVARPGAMAATHRALCIAVADAVELAESAPTIWLSGDDALAQADVAAEVAAAYGLSLYRMRADEVPGEHADTDTLITLWEREARLSDCALLVTAGTDTLPAAAVRFVERLHSTVFISASYAQALERPCPRFTVDLPDPAEQKQLWRQALGRTGDGRALVLNDALDNALDGIASQFKLSARTIDAEGMRLATTLAGSAAPDHTLWSACRSLARSKLGELAQRIEARAGWDDLILPEPQKTTLQLIGAHVRQRLKVYVDWGFADQGGRGLGISALFAGDSGTGKTMAAEILARELQLDLYRIDLAAVVSKYIGETEKNLRRVFDAAEGSGAMLLFDEADALFGKRSEIRDSHDRYANIEVGYLLQRMEAYRGLAILTTNMKTALDSAFQRRLRFVVQFPFPDQALREAIWRRAFPARVPLAYIDAAKLARLSATGGNIRNIALNAAFRAAELDSPVTMAHLLHAAHLEASKRERPVNDAETRGWV